MPDTFQTGLAFLGNESSPAFVRAPQGNGCAERFVRTLKDTLPWLQAFDTAERLVASMGGAAPVMAVDIIASPVKGR